MDRKKGRRYKRDSRGEAFYIGGTGKISLKRKKRQEGVRMHGREVKGRYHRREGKHSFKDREMGMRYGRDGRGGGGALQGRNRQNFT